MNHIVYFVGYFLEDKIKDEDILNKKICLQNSLNKSLFFSDENTCSDSSLSEDINQEDLFSFSDNDDEEDTNLQNVKTKTPKMNKTGSAEELKKNLVDIVSKEKRDLKIIKEKPSMKEDKSMKEKKESKIIKVAKKEDKWAKNAKSPKMKESNSMKEINEVKTNRTAKRPTILGETKKVDTNQEISYKRESLTPRKTKSYDRYKLTWNEIHTLNEESQYCYCGKDRDLDQLNIQCYECKNWFHQECLHTKLSLVKPFIVNYNFVCAWCLPEVKSKIEKDCVVAEDAKEFWQRVTPGWKEICLTVCKIYAIFMGKVINLPFLSLVSNLA